LGLARRQPRPGGSGSRNQGLDRRQPGRRSMPLPCSRWPAALSPWRPTGAMKDAGHIRRGDAARHRTSEVGRRGRLFSSSDFTADLKARVAPAKQRGSSDATTSDPQR
jgi:hypothetical protein